jgi:UDP-glucose-4-epimerase GalE
MGTEPLKSIAPRLFSYTSKAVRRTWQEPCIILTIELGGRSSELVQIFSKTKPRVYIHMNILVTGGAGYIGSHTAKAIASAGHTPIIFDNLSKGHAHNVRWGPLVRGDLADRSAIADVLRTYPIESVVHFAAFAYVGESMTDARRYFRNNTVSTLNLLDEMHAAGVKRIVFSSTCATYGNPVRTPIDEDHPQHPVNPYGESKLMVERMLRWLGETEGLSWIALRYFNAAGCDPEGEIGEEHDPEPHLIPRVIASALGGGLVDIYGTDYPTPDGTAVRDYIHVCDLADAHVRALDFLSSGGPSSALNLGTGRGISVREVIRSVETVSRRPVQVREAPRRLGDPPVLVADASRAARLLGWTPRYSDLTSIIETAWRWQSRRSTAALPL